MAAPGARQGLSRLLSVYRQILRAHRSQLPPPLRALGDGYVRSEVRRHADAKTTPAQWAQFEEQWCAYLSGLSGRADADEAHGATVPLNEVDVATLTPEQREQLDRLKEAARELGGGPDGEGGGRPAPPAQ